MLFKINLPEKYFGVSEKANIFIMECVPDLRFKALTKFAEATDTFLAKLRNMFYA